MRFQEVALLAFLELLDLLLEEFPQELAQLVHRDLSALVLVQDREHLSIPVIDHLATNVILGVHASDEFLDEGEYLIFLQRATVVCVYGVKNALVNLRKLFLVREDLVQVVDRSRVVDGHFEL